MRLSELTVKVAASRRSMQADQDQRLADSFASGFARPSPQQGHSRIRSPAHRSGGPPGGTCVAGLRTPVRDLRSSWGLPAKSAASLAPSSSPQAPQARRRRQQREATPAPPPPALASKSWPSRASSSAANGARGAGCEAGGLAPGAESSDATASPPREALANRGAALRKPMLSAAAEPDVPALPTAWEASSPPSKAKEEVADAGGKENWKPRGSGCGSGRGGATGGGGVCDNAFLGLGLGLGRRALAAAHAAKEPSAASPPQQRRSRLATLQQAAWEHSPSPPSSAVTPRGSPRGSPLTGGLSRTSSPGLAAARQEASLHHRPRSYESPALAAPQAAPQAAAPWAPGNGAGQLPPPCSEGGAVLKASQGRHSAGPMPSSLLSTVVGGPSSRLGCRGGAPGMGTCRGTGGAGASLDEGLSRMLYDKFGLSECVAFDEFTRLHEEHLQELVTRVPVRP